MRRKLTDAQLRELLQSRIMKGDAFRLSGEEYRAKQVEVARKLSGMTRDALLSTYPELTYDVGAPR